MLNKEKVLEGITKEEVISLTQSLVRIPSHYKVEGGETGVAEFIRGFFEKEGIKASLDEVFEKRHNITAEISGEENESLLFCGHIDTVLPDHMLIEPFTAYIEDDKIWGRGSVDMKGGNAAMIMAMAAIKRSGIKLKGTLKYAGIVGEESPNNSEGAKALVANGKVADMAIVGEATGLKIACAHKGMSWLRIDIKGKAAHASVPENGINAISIAARLITGLEDDLVEELKQKSHPFVSKPSLSIGRIEGGVQNNIVPDNCWFSLDRRYIPGEDIDTVKAEIDGIIEKVKNDYPDAEIILSEDDATEGRGPMETDVDSELVKTLEKSFQEVVQDRECLVGGVDYWTDGAHLKRCGTDTVVFGPGNIAQAHAAIEFIDIEELYTAARVYAAAALNILGYEE